MNQDKDAFERVYEKPNAVWTGTNPPEELVKLVEEGKIKPCKVIDIGCGEGFYSIYLASKGFDVLGIDLSERAIGYAKENAKKYGVDARFKALSVEDLETLNETFDFVLEWAVIHHINPDKRQAYVEKVSRILNKGGKYVSISFNENSPDFGQPGKRIRIVSPGSKALYGERVCFSSLDELNDLFTAFFTIIDSRIIKWEVGKPHIGNYFFMKKTVTSP